MLPSFFFTPESTNQDSLVVQFDLDLHGTFPSPRGNMAQTII